MADSIYTFDPTAASNTALDSIAYGPNQLYHSNIDNWMRSAASKIAQFVDDLGGVNTVGGTANAITVTIASGITAYATGQLFWFKNTPGPNTSATTINVNSIGDKEIRLQGDSALEGGEMLDNGYYGLLYDAAYDGAAGGFILLNPATSNVDAATTGAAGIVELATNAETLAGTDTSRAVTPSTLYFPTGHLYGLTLSNNGSDATNDIDIAAGTARDGSDTVNMILASALTKRLDASWAVGTGQGMLDGSESSAGTPDTSTWYHIWLIKRSDTGVVDVLASESATAPTMPTNYDYKRRIGAVYNNSSGDIRPFHQNGDRFIWDTIAQDVSTANPGTSAVSRTLTVPTGVEVDALIFGNYFNTDATVGHMLVSALTATDETPGQQNSQTGGSNTSGEAARKLFTDTVRTNTSGQVRVRVSYSSANVSPYVSTRGYVDQRGRL